MVGCIFFFERLDHRVYEVFFGTEQKGQPLAFRLWGWYLSRFGKGVLRCTYYYDDYFIGERKQKLDAHYLSQLPNHFGSL